MPPTPPEPHPDATTSSRGRADRPRRLRAEPITDPLAYHGEGALWDLATGRLLWVDMLRGDVLSMTPGTSAVERRHVGAVAARAVPRAAGGYAVATERGFSIIHPDGSIEPLPDVWTDPQVRMNEGGCDPQGRFWSGSMAYDESPGAGTLHRLDPDRTVRQVLSGVTISNGIGWSPDGSMVFYIDTPTQRIDVFTFDAEDGSLGERRTFAEIPAELGAPDGLAVDADGGVWVALWGGGAVHHHTADGALATVVELPVSQPTSCTFGGGALDVLYITTSAKDCPEPGAGSVFAVRPGTTGSPALPYRG